MNALIIWIIIIFFIINLIGILIGNYFYSVAINKNNSPSYLKDYYERESTAGNFDENRIKNLKKEDISIRSQYGYNLYGMYIENPKKSNSIVILVHGIGQDRWTMMKYGDIYLDLGYNVVIYDSRNHGQSEGEQVSYGHFEKEDLETLLQYIMGKFPEAIIGIHGESMGAATVMLHAQKYGSKGEVKFYVEDCGYSNLYDLFVVRLKEDYHLPNILIITYANIICKIRSGFFFKEISPIDDIEKLKTPMFFVHGEKDSFVPTKMALKLYNRKQGHKKLYICDGARHAESVLVNNKEYRKELSEFLDSVI